MLSIINATLSMTKRGRFTRYLIDIKANAKFTNTTCFI